MTYDFFTSTQTMLQHISEILRSPLVIVAKHYYGKRVKVVQNCGNCSMVTVGTVCGVEYLDHPDFDSGFFYQIANESGYLLYQNGEKKDFDFDKIEKVNEDSIYPL